MRRLKIQGSAIIFAMVALGAAQGPVKAAPATKPATAAKQTVIVSQKKPAKRPAKPYQVGTASWYGREFHGKTTASGEPFNMFDLTAAHPKLPLGSYVRVTNLRNGKTVVVKINDRGPIVPDRIIDLSYGAARALQLKAYGLQKVRLDVVEPQTLAMVRPVAY
jgi:rare lipoprotein A